MIDPAAQPLDDVDTTSKEGSTRTETAAGEWDGELNWMVRWAPVDSITVDFYGLLLMEALEFDLLDFNPRDFLTNVGLSVSFRVK